MPRINQNAQEENNEGLDEKVKDMLPAVVVSTNPVVICGVNRRIGLANYEHIDIYAGVALPLDAIALQDPEALRNAIAEAAEFGFNAVSQETYARYKLLADAQKNVTA